MSRFASLKPRKQAMTPPLDRAMANVNIEFLRSFLAAVVRSGPATASRVRTACRRSRSRSTTAP